MKNTELRRKIISFLIIALMLSSVFSGAVMVLASVNTTINDTPTDGEAQIDTDTKSPIISDVSTVNITANSTTITWRTDKTSDSVVKYGTETGSYTLFANDPSFVTDHCIKITGLLPSTIYYYVVNSTDSSGNQNESVEYNFNTLPESEGIVDVSPPTLTFVPPTPPNNSIVNESEIIITITANEYLDSAILDWNGKNETMHGSEKDWYIDKSLTSGTCIYRVYGKDTADNWAVSGTRAVIVVPETDYEPTTVIAPDLAVSNITLSNLYPIEGEDVTINATIGNLGTADVTGVTVQFFDGTPTNGTQIGANHTIASFNAGDNETVSVVWDTTGEAGDNCIWVVADPADTITEPDEENNQASKSIFVGAPTVLNIVQAQTDRAAYLCNEAVTISCIVQHASRNISANVSAEIEKPDSGLDNIALEEGLTGIYSGKFANTSLSGRYSVTIYANRTGFVCDTESLSFEVLDTTPPSSITNLTSTTGSTWINWTWDNPLDPDFDFTLIYLNGSGKTATAENYYLASGLNASTEYEIATQTVDVAGNINATWVNQTAETKAENLLPVANFTDSPESPIVNQMINFNASNSTDPDGNITKYDWDFGDGNSTNTTEAIVNHSYLLAGDYTVNLTVTDNEGAMNSSSQWIIVTLKAPPEITFFAPPSHVNDTVCTWRTFNVTANQTVNVSWYLNGTFQFTNVSVREAKCKLHAAVAGEHNVTTIASNANGTDMQSWVWNVTAAPLPVLEINKTDNPLNCTCGDICVNETGWWHDGGAFIASGTPIQDAINNAIAGETICVKDGTYTENVNVNKSLTIRSENGSASTTVQASNSNDHVFELTADYVNISGFTATGATGSVVRGIYLNSVQHCNISGNNCSNNTCGIRLYSSSNNNLTSNTAKNNYYGIYLYASSNNNNLTSNTASYNEEGIGLYSSSNNNLTSNTASYNNGVGIRLSSSSNNNLTSNTAKNNVYGIFLYSSSNNNTLTSNTAKNNNVYGIFLSSSSNNTLTSNTASNTYGYGYGIRLSSSSNNNLTSNTAKNNYYGIYLSSSSNNRIYNNYFNNTNNAYDDGNNAWNITKTAGTNIIGGLYLGGNYWSDYAGADNDGDGLGDTMLPYNSSGNITNGGDWHPLVQVGVAPPNITSFAPPSPVNDTVCNWRTFNVTVNQTVNVSWYLNNTLQHTNVSTKEASYSLHAEVVSEHNVSTIASNANGTDMQTWVWNVAASKPPEITSFAPPSPVNDTEGATRTFNITVNQTVNVSWQINGSVIQMDIKVTEASYTNTSAVIGTRNVSAIVNNANGSDMQTWVWTVEPSPCFIATAAYGTALHEDINVLRDLRDEYMMPNPAGRAFVKTYYTLSPPIADVIRANEWLQTAVRDGFVKPLVHITEMFVG